MSVINVNEYLESLKVKSDSKLVSAVIDDLLNIDLADKDLVQHMEDITIHGCSSGIVTSLTYYYQTDAFFEKHYEEIFELYNENSQEFDVPMELSANSLSWWSYEHITYELLNQVQDYIDSSQLKYDAEVE